MRSRPEGRRSPQPGWDGGLVEEASLQERRGSVDISGRQRRLCSSGPVDLLILRQQLRYIRK